MPPQSVARELVQAVRVVVVGRVQGLGARPTAARVAASLGLAGGIANTSDGLLLELEGSAGELESFLRDFRSALPAGAEIDELRSEPIMPRGLVGFEIGESDGVGARGAAVPPDQVVCPRCLAEVRDASDRRHDYAFTSCTTCGPRYSILQAMPYDRATTSMGRFVMCAECSREYCAPSDRRFHAQTNACPNCGPRLVLQDVERPARRRYKDELAAVPILHRPQVKEHTGVDIHVGVVELVEKQYDLAVCLLEGRRQSAAEAQRYLEVAPWGNDRVVGRRQFRQCCQIRAALLQAAQHQLAESLLCQA